MVTTKKLMELAAQYAGMQSTCRKVSVGAVIVRYNRTQHKNDARIISFGANVSVPSCTYSCMRQDKYGDDSKNHRLPSDCRSVHAEIDAIINAKQDLTGCWLYVTRYPCEACARAIVLAGISNVYYGRQQPISQQTQNILESGHVNVVHFSSYSEEDRND